MNNYKRLNLEDRIVIEKALDNNDSLNVIAKRLNRSLSSISREIKRNRSLLNTYSYGRKNRCVYKNTCLRNDVCLNRHNCKNRRCASCRKMNCSNMCSDYIEEVCASVSKSPYVCNACLKRRNCALKKYLYKAIEADKLSRQIKIESRSGINLNEEELFKIDDLISTRLFKGQSIHHIFTSEKDLVTISERTAYKYLNGGLFKAKNIDAPRIIRMKPRKGKKPQIKVDKKCRINRTYDDYLNYLKDNPDTPILQGDSVEGIKGGKCILTLTWVYSDFQLGFIRDFNNSKSVIDIIDKLYKKMGKDLFLKVFPPVWLLDNGCEFSNPLELEKYGIKIFYCDPSSPYQKGACENTHSLLRRILPKGTSFNDLTQNDFDLIYSHINSLVRKKLNDKSPYDIWSELFVEKEDIIDIFNIRKIEPKDVYLKYDFLKVLK